MRLFIAIDINDDVRAAVAKLQQELKGRMKNQNGLKWVNPELMHLTLKFLGEADENRIDEINDAVEIACADKKTFEFSFSVVGTFGRPVKVLWLGSEPPHLLAQSSGKENLNRSGYTGKLDIPKADVNRCGGEKLSAELAGLAGDIEQALEAIGFERESRPFSAHLTLARVRDNGVDKNLRQLLKNYTQVQIPQIVVDSVCLYKSQLTSDGPVYTLLRKIELKKDI
jgi:2'-5' RNA ligase